MLDKNYIIIKKYVDKDYQDQLFEHTRKLQTSNSSVKNWLPTPPPENNAALLVNLEDQSFSGPNTGKGPYVSLSILGPVITIERRREELHIAARFNLETTILRYSSRKR